MEWTDLHHVVMEWTDLHHVIMEWTDLHHVIMEWTGLHHGIMEWTHLHHLLDAIGIDRWKEIRFSFSICLEQPMWSFEPNVYHSLLRS